MPEEAFCRLLLPWNGLDQALAALAEADQELLVGGGTNPIGGGGAPAQYFEYIFLKTLWN